MAETPIESARRAERALRDALMLVPTLFFSRRLISASSNVLLTAGPTGIFGSVTESDILEAIKEYGVTLSEGMGSIEGIETSRIKDVGKFTCTSDRFPSHPLTRYRHGATQGTGDVYRGADRGRAGAMSNASLSQHSTTIQ